jgi:group I intron endonuclease
MGFIYKITNLITNKLYIGKTTESCPEKRWLRHKQTIAKGTGCPALQDAVNRYGIENFKFEVLIICFDEATNQLEIEYIKKFNSIVPNGYNISKGGEGGGFIGKQHSDKTKELIKQRAIQYYTNPENRKNTANKLKTFYEQEGAKDLARQRTIASEKWKKAKEEGRIGTNKTPPTAETKEKIRIGLLKYNETRRTNTLIV